MRLMTLILLLGCVGMCYGELKVGDESAEAWKDRVFRTNDCAWTAFHAGRVSGFLDGYDMAEDRYASDDCLTAGECDDRANVRWIQGWQDGAEAIRQCYSNDFQNGYAIGYLRGQIECASNTVYVTNAVEGEK